VSDADRARWDERWAALAGQPFRPNPLLAAFLGELSGGQALDLACGRGQDALWLAGRGYQVLGVDISPVALEQARAAAGALGVEGLIRFERRDLDGWVPPAAAYDLICVFRYLDRRLFPFIRLALRPGGLLFYQTRHLGALSHQPGATRAYLLRPGELRRAFPDWQALLSHEGESEAELVARKPLSEQAVPRP
jgi:SAM-dependent methyltransferase